MGFAKSIFKFLLYLILFAIIHQYIAPFVAYIFIVIIFGWKIYAAIIRYIYK